MDTILSCEAHIWTHYYISYARTSHSVWTHTRLLMYGHWPSTGLLPYMYGHIPSLSIQT